MKGIVHAALAASLIAGAAADSHHHQHRHLHAKVVGKRADKTVTSVVAGPTVVEYVLDGEKVDKSKAEQGVEDGRYVVIGESTPTFNPPPPPSTTTTAIPTGVGAEFYEKKTSSTAAPSPSAVAAGIDSDFPSGKIPCSKFPSNYGAVAIDWLGTDGWTSLQQPDSYTPGVGMSNIVAPISGGCKSGMFCSYACPDGYQKTQWPETQGATGQSVGGLYCNDNGFLELTRPSHPKICEKGVGNVWVQNKLSGKACVCRTDYPASENMVIPIETTPGGKYALTNPDSEDYYVWQGKTTTAQYYINNLDVDVEQACVWTSSKFPNSAGNWAPVNVGVGRDALGVTWISIFPNAPTSQAKLDFNIEITGDVAAPCYLKNGKYYGGLNGCTVSYHHPLHYS